MPILNDAILSLLSFPSDGSSLFYGVPAAASAKKKGEKTLLKTAGRIVKIKKKREDKLSLFSSNWIVSYSLLGAM